MSSKKNQVKNAWEETHELLQESMKKEIATMREILGNMREEEQSLLVKDSRYVDLLMEKRDELVTYLGKLRLERVAFMEKLSFLFADQTNEDTSPMTDIQKCETLLLCDQITALAEKIHLQNRSNFFLSQHLSSQPIPLKEEKKKKKLFLQTEEES